jgi:tRNA dimethylallyltransferase
MQRLITIIGPTAVGKSELAMFLARHFPIDIINADSRQIYRYMNIGTGKPTLDEQQLVPHHLIDIINPDQNFNLATYHRLASESIISIQRKGKIPVLVGGSGLYIWSTVEGWEIPQVAPDYKLRRELEIVAEQEGSDSLYLKLQQIDSIAASKIHPNNTRRIIRALEIYYGTGKCPSGLRHKESPAFSTFIIGLTAERNELYNRIDQRVGKMIQKGLVEEVKDLSQMGYDSSLPSMSSIGYNQIHQFLKGQLTFSMALEKIKSETHRLARHQYAWFQLKDKRIQWLDTGTNGIKEKATELIERYLS